MDALPTPVPEAPAKKPRLWLRTLLGLCGGLLAGAIALGWLGVSQREVMSTISGVSLAPLLFVAAGSLVLAAIQALRWWIVMRPVLKLGYVQSLSALLVGFFGNVLLPARGGDLLRVQYLGKKHNVSRAKLLGTELVDFWSDKWGWITAFAVICLIGRPPAWLYGALGTLGSVVLSVACVMALMGSRLGRLDAKGRPRGPKWLTNLRDGFAASQWKRLLLVETVIAPLPWLWETLVIVVGAQAVGVSLTVVQAFAVLTAFNLATVVPSPGNAGSFEAGGTLALVSMGVPKDTALAFILLYHLAMVLPGIVCGASLLIANGDGISVLWRKKPAEALPGEPQLT